MQRIFSSARIHAVLLFLLPGCTLLTLALLRWKHFGDPQVDWGQELTVAWEIANGKILYADIAYYRGPLSPYVNALLMRGFGATVQTIMMANFTIATLITYGIFWLTRRATSFVYGSVAATVFSLMFAFGEQSYVNCFNYITPFVHELTHGLLLSILCIITLEKFIDTRRMYWIATAGALYGLALLTRIEVGATLTATLIAWAAIVGWKGPMDRKQWFRPLWIFCLSALIVVGTSIGLLQSAMGFRAAFQHTFTSYWIVFTTPIAQSPFYAFVTGTVHPLKSITLLVVALLLYAYWMMNFYFGSRQYAAGDLLGASILIGLGFSPVLYGTFHEMPPLLFGIILPITTVCIVIGILMKIVHHRGNITPALRVSGVTGIFALLFLSKIPLAPEIRFYGFAHAMPAYLLLILTMLLWVPAYVRTHLSKKAHALFTVLMTITILCDIFAIALLDQRISNAKVLELGEGAQSFFVPDKPRFRPYKDFLEHAKDLIHPGSTLSAIPEGAMMNFMLGLPLGTEFTNYLPTDFMIYGKERMVQSLFSHRPDFILITHKDTTEFGTPHFGSTPEYGKDIVDWLQENYTQVAVFGRPPLESVKSEGLALWRRNDLR